MVLKISDYLVKEIAFGISESDLFLAGDVAGNAELKTVKAVRVVFYKKLWPV